MAIRMKYSVKPCCQFMKCDTKLGLLTPGSLIFSHIVRFLIDLYLGMASKWLDFPHFCERAAPQFTLTACLASSAIFWSA